MKTFQATVTPRDGKTETVTVEAETSTEAATKVANQIGGNKSLVICLKEVKAETENANSAA